MIVESLKIINRAGKEVLLKLICPSGLNKTIRIASWRETYDLKMRTWGNTRPAAPAEGGRLDGPDEGFPQDIAGVLKDGGQGAWGAGGEVLHVFGEEGLEGVGETGGEVCEGDGGVEF